MGKYMILLGGRPAMHKMGNIGRKEDDHIIVQKEDDKHYIGHFAEGFGFIDVKFKKEDCRNLIKEEIDELNGKYYSISGKIYGRISIDDEGNIIHTLNYDLMRCKDENIK